MRVAAGDGGEKRAANGEGAREKREREELAREAAAATSKLGGSLQRGHGATGILP